MSITFWNLFELVVNLFEGLNCLYFVCNFLGCRCGKGTGRGKWLLMGSIFAAVTTAINHLTFFDSFYLLVYVLVLWAEAAIWLKGTWYKKLFTAVTAVTCLIFVSTLLTNLVTALAGVPIEVIYTQSGTMRFLTVVMVQAVDVHWFRLLLRVFCREEIKLQTVEWQLFLGVFLLSAAAVVCMQLVQLHGTFSLTDRFLLLAANASIACVNAAVVRLILRLNRQYRTELENDLLRRQLAYQAQYSGAVQEKAEAINLIRHELKNSMLVIENLTEQGRFSEVREYVAQYAGKSGALCSFVQTGNPYVDAIVNSKLSYARAQGVAVSAAIEGNLPELAAVDYCSLLGNLLDNAVEASIKQQTERELELYLTGEDDKLQICVRNRVDSDVCRENPRLFTTKHSKSEHGFGIRVIREIAENYGGEADFFVANGFFHAQIIVYSPNNS